ncbi:hypothetical protein [Caloranaerobacter sp. DY30410]|uniref:hypothetical protein n=1 Tax=Caloranaerobacter sp. DY30410 TaxID=3238305 RepID=UPI003CFF96E9
MNFKSISKILLFVLLSLYLNTSVFASPKIDDITPDSRHSEGYTWRIKSIIKNIKTETKGNWNLIYEGNPAQRNGETDTISYSTTYSHTYTGSFAFTLLKRQVEFALGYSFGKSESFSGAKTSAPLKKNEYIKAYIKRNYRVSKVIQEELYYNTKNRPIYKPTGKTKIVYCYEAILPKIKITYHMAPNTRSQYKLYNSSLISHPYREEYYEPTPDGNYRLYKVIEYSKFKNETKIINLK